MEKIKAQIWVETVVYTLIGISIIGILLAIARPRIDEIRDRLLIEQTIESFNQMHERIVEIQASPGSQRILNFKLSRGKIIINSSSDEIIWSMESKYRYSQPGSTIELGKIRLRTEISHPYKIFIFLSYPEYNLSLSGEEKILEMEESPTPYPLIFLNEGSGRIRIRVQNDN